MTDLISGSAPGTVYRRVLAVLPIVGYAGETVTGCYSLGEGNEQRRRCLLYDRYLNSVVRHILQ